MGIQAKNTVSTPHSGDTTFPQNTNRSYFFIVMTTGTGTIEFGGGGGKIPLEEGAHYNPPVCPTGEILVETTGDFVVHMG